MTALLNRSALVLALSLLAGPAVAAEVELPLDLAFCEARDSVEAKLDSPNELSLGVVEAEGKAFGVRGTITTVFEDEILVTVRWRGFETEDVFNKVSGALVKLHGEGVVKDRTREGMTRNLSRDWEIDAEQTVQLRVSSEQISVNWEIWASRCIAEEAPQEGLTAAEKADIEASTKKKAIDFDPLAEDIEDVDERKKESDDAKKSEAQVEEEKRKETEPPPDDVEIDW
jgi:hypothetical protein